MTYIAVATEDEISEFVCGRLVEGVGLSVGQQLRKGGNGYLRSRTHAFAQMAQHYPVVLLTDLDDEPCAPDLVARWRGAMPFPENFLLRVAVREIEAWLLADYLAISEFFQLRDVRNFEPEHLGDPKAFLLQLARRAPRDIRLDMVAEEGALASQGLGYNRRLIEFVDHHWSPDRAAQGSPSLAKARQRLSELSARLYS